MIGRIIEINSPGLFVSLEKGFMCISDSRDLNSKIPISDIAVLIFTGHGNMVSTNLIYRLQEEGAIVVLTGKNYHPCSIMWPIVGHYKHHERIHTQINCSLPLKKKIWKEIVTNKILNQASVLQFYYDDDFGLLDISRSVNSGDIDNKEAQASRKYWKILFGSDFIRDPEIEGINALLNYGYSIIRASVARSVSCCGLHPALGINHHNKNNPFCLVDDLIEPFRPIVDFYVKYLKNLNFDSVNIQTKCFLASILDHDLKTKEGISPVCICILKLVQKFYNSIESGGILLEFPENIIPIEPLKIA